MRDKVDSIIRMAVSLCDPDDDPKSVNPFVDSVMELMATAWDEGRNAKHRVAWEAETSHKPIVEPVNPYKVGAEK